MWYGQVEGTEIVVLDKRFNDCFAGHVRVERLWTGARWAEGPAWFAAGRYLIAAYLTHAGVASAYGAAGSLAAVLVWCYASAQIFLYGACVMYVPTQPGAAHKPEENTP